MSCSSHFVALQVCMDKSGMQDCTYAMQSTLAQPVSYVQQQYQQQYGQGQYTYPSPIVPMTMPYMGQHYDGSSSPHHMGKPGSLQLHSNISGPVHASCDSTDTSCACCP